MKKEFFGQDLETALQKASARLCIPLDELQYEQLDETFCHPFKPDHIGIVVEYEAARALPQPAAADLAAEVEELRDRPDECAAFILTRILGHLGMVVDVSAEENGGLVLLKVKFLENPPDTRRGEIRELRGAVQYIVNRAINEGKERESRFIIDFGGDLEDRSKMMEKVAGELSEKVAQLGETVNVMLMDSQDRRLLHMALVDDPGVTTSSRGDGRFRVMCIEPKKQ